MFGNIGFRPIDKEVVNGGFFRLPMNGMTKVIGVQDGVLLHRLQSRPVAVVVSPAANHRSGVAVPLLYFADAVFGLFPVVPVFIHSHG